MIVADVSILYRGTDKIMNNSFVQLSDVEWDFVTCTMSANGKTSDSFEGKWYYPNGAPVSCTSATEPFNCQLTEDRLGIQLYRNPNLRGKDGVKKVFDPGVYSCCLPSICDDGKSIRATLRIWGQFYNMQSILS